LLSNSARLVVYLPKITDHNVELLKGVAPFVHDAFNTPGFLKSLNELKDKDPGNEEKVAEYLSDIYIEMISRNKPVYDPEDIRSTIEFIYRNGDESTKAKANQICSRYGESDEPTLLRDIWEKYKSKMSDQP
jgi:hypothetical protein